MNYTKHKSSNGRTCLSHSRTEENILKCCKRLFRSFYDRPVLTVARALLGKHLVRVTSEGRIVAKITEVEAYGATDDPASHAHKGITKRNRVMFGDPGHAYVYFTYGMHFCLNVKAEHRGIPGAVLIRAIEIVDGLELARRYRKTVSYLELSNGPGKLTKAMNITRTHDGLDLVKSDELYICDPEEKEESQISSSARIGIKEGTDKLWRFSITKSQPI